MQLLVIGVHDVVVFEMPHDGLDRLAAHHLAVGVVEHRLHIFELPCS